MLYINLPSCVKTNNLGSRPGRTQTELYKHRRWLEAGKFRFRKTMTCYSFCKTEALISCAVTAQLICAFGFAYAGCSFSYTAAQL